jgi:hypothetical protein
VTKVYGKHQKSQISLGNTSQRLVANTFIKFFRRRRKYYETPKFKNLEDFGEDAEILWKGIGRWGLIQVP